MSRWPNKYVIGLTGNIAVGKSVVRQMLQHLGALTLDADALSHQAMMPQGPAYKPVINAFGQFIVGADGQINRALLGQIVFSNPEALKKLEGIIHPIVRQAINALITRAKQPVVVVEAIKLLEGGLSEVVDAVWVVDAKPQTQYKRLITKRKMSPEDAKQRILSQTPQAEKIKQAHVVINNEDSIDETWKQVQAAWTKIKQQQAITTSENVGVVVPPSAPDGKLRVQVKRGTPSNAQQIADYINRLTGQAITRIDVMMNFGQKSYFIAYADDKHEKIALLAGWTVENLVTRIDEFYLDMAVAPSATIPPMMSAIEESSKELQSEVCFVFLPENAPEPIQAALKGSAYPTITLPEIKVPPWREAVNEVMKQKKSLVFWKQLGNRVLQPI